MEQNFYNIPIDFDVKRQEPIKDLTRGQGEDYTTGCLLDYECIRNHCILMVVD